MCINYIDYLLILLYRMIPYHTVSKVLIVLECEDCVGTEISYFDNYDLTSSCNDNRDKRFDKRLQVQDKCFTSGTFKKRKMNSR